VRKKDEQLSPDEMWGKLNTALAFKKLKHQFYVIKLDEGI
jgi:hypothetical protein